MRSASIQYSLEVIGIVVLLACSSTEAQEARAAVPLSEQAVMLAKAGLNQQEHGDYKSSEESFRRAVERYEQAGLNSDPGFADALNGLGAAVYYRGRNQEAEALYRRALAIFQRRNQPTVSWAATMKNLCTLDRERMNLGEAEELCRKAAAMIQSAGGSTNFTLASAYAELAVIAKARGDLAAAQQFINQAEELEKKSSQPERLPLWTLWTIRGEILSAQGAVGEAEVQFQRGFDGCSRALGLNNVRCASALNGVGLSMASRGATADAERTLERALHIFESNYGLSHPRVVAVLTNLGSLAISTRDFGKAQKLLEQAAAICEKVLGPDHPDTAATFINLAGVYVQRHKLGQAESLYNRALEIDRNNHVPAYKLAADFNHLGVFFYSTRQWDKSEEAFLQSIKLYEHAFGADHVAIAGVLGNLAEEYRVEGRDRDAAAAYQRAFAIWGRHPDVVNTKVATILDHYATLMRKTADYAEANRAEAEAMRIRVKKAVANTRASSLIAR
jgi:tetratricopeptide (TPR) repeat protein